MNALISKKNDVRILGKFGINLIPIIVSALGSKLLCSQNFEDEVWQK